jgi:hypothetical protein
MLDNLKIIAASIGFKETRNQKQKTRNQTFNISFLVSRFLVSSFHKVSLAMALSFLVSVQLISVTLADEVTVYYSLIPPRASLTIQEKLFENKDTENGVMRFQKEFPETYTIGSVEGLKIGTLNYRVDIQKETKFKLQQDFVLLEGSVHTDTTVKGKQNKIRIGEVVVNFRSAEFIAFRGGGGEVIVKVIDGEIEASLPNKEQTVTVSKEEFVETDTEGKLRAPQKYTELSSKWWEERAYTYNYQELPVAHAGQDQQVLPGFVTLDGRGSTYSKGDLVVWTLEDGPVEKVAFDNSISILQPVVKLQEEGIYHFSVIFKNTQGKQSNKAVTTVSVGRKYAKPIEIFPDVPVDSSNNIAIAYLYEKGYVKGYVDEKTETVVYKPNQLVNRVEVLQIVLKSSKIKVPSLEELDKLNPQLFSDVSKENWFAPLVSAAKNAGLIKGSNNEYRPGDPVNLVELLQILAKLNKINLSIYDGLSSPYPNIERDQWYNPLLYFSRKHQLYDSDHEGNVDPSHKMTRGDVAEVIYRMETSNLSKRKGYFSGVMKDKKGNVVKEMNLLIYKAVPDVTKEDGTVESWKKGDLFLNEPTKINGTFGIPLQVDQMYSAQGLNSEKGTVTGIFTFKIKEENEEVSATLILNE